ncbi:hypothetical protein OG604_47255 [Streptomyces sp. NBC_01231]|nr:hypothetical protein OG604_47255 [Streptomyces sp. NBC_01231]
MTHRSNVVGIHDALVGLATELKRRTDLAVQHDERLDDVPRLIVVLDRTDGTMRHLARYWETFRQEGKPKKSPAITALKEVLYEGRQARVHVLCNGRAYGGLSPSVREQFATVILVRGWHLHLAAARPDSRPRPEHTAHPGCVRVVRASPPTRRRRSS